MNMNVVHWDPFREPYCCRSRVPKVWDPNDGPGFPRRFGPAG